MMIDENQKKRKKQLIISITAIVLLIVATVGVTYAFFNYTRTGSPNTIATGRIYFNTSQSGRLQLTNVFPVKSTEVNANSLDSVTVGIVGDTTYTDGEEFEITLVDVENTINNKKIPINYIATYTANTGGTIGTSSDTYFTSRESKDATIYKLNATGSVEENTQVLVGYIDNGPTGINGTLTIKAYVDGDRIAISDTYNPNAVEPIPNGNGQGGNDQEGGTQQKANNSKGKVKFLAGESNPTTDEYGTTSEWVNGRTVFTTEEWNSFATNPISFKIRAESNEGIWVEEPSNGTIESCPNCKFIYTTDSLWTTWYPYSVTPTELTSGYSTNYNDIVTTSGKNYFLGVVTNASNQITNAYACALYNGTTPFCIEGTADGANYSSISSFINGSSLWNNTCTVDISNGYTECGSWDGSSVSAYADSNGVLAGVSDDYFCYVYSNGEVSCDERDGGE